MSCLAVNFPQCMIQKFHERWHLSQKFCKTTSWCLLGVAGYFKNVCQIVVKSGTRFEQDNTRDIKNVSQQKTFVANLKSTKMSGNVVKAENIRESRVPTHIKDVMKVDSSLKNALRIISERYYKRWDHRLKWGRYRPKNVPLKIRLAQE